MVVDRVWSVLTRVIGEQVSEEGLRATGGLGASGDDAESGEVGEADREAVDFFARAAVLGLAHGRATSDGGVIIWETEGRRRGAGILKTSELLGI